MFFAPRSADRPSLIDLLIVDGFSLMSLAATMEPLRAAKVVRRTALRRGGDHDAAREAAHRHFGLPATSLAFTAGASG